MENDHKHGEKMANAAGYKHYIAGLLAGLGTVVTGHPFDTVKVKMQKHNTEVQGIKYRNGLHCATRILATEGVRGLYTGATSSFIGMAFESSLAFGIYSQTKQALLGGVQSSSPELQAIIPSAAFAGSIISFILCPSELVKDASPGYRFLSSIIPQITGLFCGGYATLLRESVGNAVFFSTYEYVRYYMHLPPKSGSSGDNHLIDMGIGITSGGLGGIACWLAVLPLDVAKTIIQTAPGKSTPRNPFRVLNTIYRRAGIKGCYAGLGPTITRAFPANAAAIVTWELALKLLGIERE